MTARPTSGGPVLDDYLDQTTVDQFEHIVGDLTRDLASTVGEESALTAKDLSHLTYELQYFQEKALGAEAPHTGSRPVRIPATFFRHSTTLSSSSPLYRILKSAYEYRHSHHWQHWDFSNSEKTNQHFGLLNHIRADLVSQGIIRNPTVAFGDSVSSKELEVLSAAVTKLGGSIESDATQATHIIYQTADDDGFSEEDTIRAVEKQGSKTLIHYRFYPSSYDSWVEGDFKDPAPTERSEAWNVSTRWIKDSEKFNEWTNEEDYEQAADSPSNSSQRSTSKRDNPETGPESLAKRVKRSPSVQDASVSSQDMFDQEMEIVPDNTPSTFEVDSMDVDSKEEESKAKQVVSKLEELKADAADQDSNRGSAPPEEEALTQAEAERFQMEEEAGRYLSQQTQEVIVPSYAAWFSLTKIHEIEHKSLPEFFNLKNRSKTPTVYKDYRDFMVNTYRLNPTEYLTVTACRRNLAGDVCAIIRVHSFLEQWGLINYQVDPETRPSSVGPAFTGHFRVTADTPRGLQPFYPSVPAPVAAAANAELKAQKGSKTNGSLDLRRAHASGSKDEESPEQRQRFTCFTCGTDCTKIRYHSIKTRNFELCSNCYLEGRFPSAMSSGDFLRLNAQHFKHASDDTWTDQETLLLLEGLEQFDDDWNLVADHVGTRSREQCILHFLQLPIEDPYLDETSERELGALQYNRIPFSQADNPVMSVVAFLSSVVNPQVATTAAQNALKELETSKKKSRSSKSITKLTAAKGEEADGEKKEANGSDATTMDVDSETKDATSDTEEKQVEEEKDETEEVQGLISQVVESQLKKFELKLQQFEELESVLETEKRELERQRQQLYLDRLAMKKSISGMQEKMMQARQAILPQALVSGTPAPEPSQVLNGAPAASIPVAIPGPVPVPGHQVPASSQFPHPPQHPRPHPTMPPQQHIPPQYPPHVPQPQQPQQSQFRPGAPGGPGSFAPPPQ
ncbi:hypothetical protein BGZ93_004368 [Podila epicladia]|nr:hypothetical protein BGZ92_005036 [Podila epicladia]KAG0096548.1 hypothetical protein BGZ93_004368 [Podila epicladia]